MWNGAAGSDGDNRPMPSPTDTEPDFSERIVDVDVGQEMRGSFLEYAYSVIYSRALPDARDGMKPVQRRILYQSAEMGLRPDRGHVKSARVVGEVMGRLHPHGEGAIYDALVRMAQPFSLRLPFIDGHGNFGSLDDGPAAMRYTECRLATAAMPMVADIHEDTVDFAPNYDGRELEPTVLPAAIPSLLVNGTTGIAVGMATNIPPHNLGEVIAAARHLLKHPKATTESLMRFVPGPDLPSGGRIIGLDGIREAYATGRGTFKMRATTSVEQVTARRRAIVVTELPFNVGVERVIQRIKDLHTAKKIAGISGLTDLTDGDKGLRLQIELKSGINPEALLAELYRLTPMEEQFSVNAVALVEGAPRTLGLRELLGVFLDHRRDVVRRRSEFRRRKAQERLHLVEGLLIAILDIDEVIAVIRSSDDAASARTRLMTIFDLSEAQGNYILDMPLRRLTKFSTLELESEREELNATIAALTEILDHEDVLTRTVSDELAEVAAAHATPRRTVLLEAPATKPAPGDQLSMELEDSPCAVLLDATGLIARVPLATAPPGGRRGSHSALAAAVSTTTRAELGLVTSRGRVVRLPVVDLPALPGTAGHPSLVGGAEVAEFAGLSEGERCVGVVPLDAVVALGTARGTVKRVLPEQVNKHDWPVISLRDGDEVVSAAACDDDAELVFVTDAGQLLRFGADAVRPQGRGAGGMAGIKLGEDARVATFAVVAATDADAMVVTCAGTRRRADQVTPTSWKLTPLAAFPAKGRATAGVRCQRLRKEETAVVLAAVGPAPGACDRVGKPVGLPQVEDHRDAPGVPTPRGLRHLAAAGLPLADPGDPPDGSGSPGGSEDDTA